MIPTLALVAATAGPAQGAPPAEATWLRVGAYLPYASQPGLSAVGTRDLHTWTGRNKGVALSVGPRVGVFGRSGNHVSGLAGAEASLRWTRADTGRFFSLDGGLAYVMRAQTTELAVDLGSGEVDRTRELQHHALPTLGLHVGRNKGTVGWFAGSQFGRHLSPQSEDSLWFALEAGVRFGGAR